LQEIPTIAAAEGMVLAKDILLDADRILCGKGTVLTAGLIDRLQRMEIAHVTVEGHPVEIEGEKTLAEELADLDRRFSRVNSIPPLLYLKRRIRERLLASREGADG